MTEQNKNEVQENYRKKCHDEYCEWLEMQDALFEDDIDRSEVWFEACKARRFEHLKESKRWEDIIFIMDDQDLTPELLKIKIGSLEYGNEHLKTQLEDRDQEIERLERARRCECGNVVKYAEEYDHIEQMKERDELIKEAIPWITDSVFPNYKNADQRIWGKETEEIKKWLEKANKITKGEG